MEQPVSIYLRYILFCDRKLTRSLWLMDDDGPLMGTVMLAERPFRILGVQQVAIGGLDKKEMNALWLDVFGLTKVGLTMYLYPWSRLVYEPDCWYGMAYRSVHSALNARMWMRTSCRWAQARTQWRWISCNR